MREGVTEPPVPTRIYHITHVDNLASILSHDGLLSDAEMIARGGPQVAVGMSTIKQRRLRLPVKCHAGDYVGDYVPFYFCPRSIMLYLLHMGNHPELSYRGGQGPIVHLEPTWRPRHAGPNPRARGGRSASPTPEPRTQSSGVACGIRRRRLSGRRQLGLQVARGQRGQAGGVPRSAILPVAPRRARWRPRCADPSSGAHRTVGCRASSVRRRPPPLVLSTWSWSSTHRATSFKPIPRPS